MRAVIEHERVEGKTRMFGHDDPPRYLVNVLCEFTRAEEAIIIRSGIATIDVQEVWDAASNERISVSLVLFTKPRRYEFKTKFEASECDRELVTQVLPKIKMLLEKGADALSKPASRVIEL